MIHQVVFDTAELLYRKGIRHVVLSPGSRNAPLTLSFARHPKLKIYSIVDERSAGFIALGIAQRTQQPVVICCTSGTALLNYLPAIAEAFYQQTPLLIITADRPPEWIGQRDGQTIHQSGVTDNFTKGFLQMPVSLDHSDSEWEYNRKLNEAVNLCNQPPKGPVHVNVPFREPFYPEKSQKLSYSDYIRIIENFQDAEKEVSFPNEFIDFWIASEKKLMVIGQQDPVDDLARKLLDFSGKTGTPIVTDVISNLNDEGFIKYHDHYLGKLSPKMADSLKPDLVISCGRSVISKSLKQFLRKNKPVHHWHFENSDQIADTFQSLTWKAGYSIEAVIEKLSDISDEPANTDNRHYSRAWQSFDEKAKNNLSVLNEELFSEYKASWIVSNEIPENYSLHLSNSMPVRYANLLRNMHPGVEVYCNRGTSGIDGSNGTAVGDALVNGKNTLLWSGDLAFFYDRNAFFHHHDLSNLKVIIMNNQGGGIFRLINGPGLLPELEKYFETRHDYSVRSMAESFNFEYHSANDEKSLKVGLNALFRNEKGKKLLEIFTEPSVNEEVYKKIKSINYD